jgi:hypothetical protein
MSDKCWVLCLVPLVLQSILTGESHSVDKFSRVVLDPKAVYQDKINILFSVRADEVHHKIASSAARQAFRLL